jgi:hypothetical protein
MAPAKRPKQKRPTKRSAAKRAPELVDMLAAAAWTQADAALAEALVECDRAVQADSDETREEALSMVSLALARAARRRGLARLGTAGAIEDFDPAKHELPAPLKRAPPRVRIVEAGVLRGAEVLVRARAKPVRAKRK